MSLAVVDRRRANAFAQALDESGARPEQPETDLPRLLGTVDLLKERFPVPPASPDFRAALRQRLLDEAAAASATAELPAVPAPRGTHRRHGTTGTRRPAPWRRRLAVAGALVAVTGTGLGSVAYASTDALPGDLTYGVKRTMESWDRSLADSDRERGEIYLRQARTRMDEAERLLGRSNGRVDRETVGHLRQVFSDMHDQTRRGRQLLTRTYEREHKIGPMQDLASFATAGTLRMDRMNTRLPAELHEDRDQVVNLLMAITQQVSPIPGAYEDDRERAADVPGPGSLPGQQPGGGRTAGPDGRQGGGTAAPGATDAARPGSGATSSPGLVPGLNIPLLGPTTDPSATGGTSPSGAAESGGTSPGLTIPPLLPGLPGLGITLGGD